jgi:RimJ/RimL family protein N-acetyltransferase
MDTAVPQVTVRDAAPGDAAQVFAWRNLPDIVALSERRNTVGREEHEAWFAAALRDEDRMLLVIGADGENAGLIRFDRAGDTALVGIYLVGPYKGRKIGGRALTLALDKVRKAWGVNHAEARIRRENEASRRFFAVQGFSFAAGDGAMAVYKYEWGR